jgi:DNA gyrase subunit A
VDGQGNFGSIDGDAAAAYRYTEARLAAVSLELLDDLEKETVAWTDNFDGRLREPSVLPARLPNLLVNGSAGIAVGMSTNVPPHNLTEVAAAFGHLVENPGCSVEDLMEHLPGPDFPTGGFIVGRDGIRDMYRTGRGRLVVRGRVRKETLRGGKEQLVVAELPYGVSKARIIEQIVELSRKGKLPDVSDVRDESDRDGMRLVIELKRGVSAPPTLKTLYRGTALEATFGAILLALDKGQPREFKLIELLERYRDHRLEVVVRRSRHDLEAAEAERHVLEGLLLAVENIDRVIAIIRKSKDRPQAAERLRKEFGLSEVQADAILNMRLGRLTSLERDELTTRMAELKRLIKELRALLGSEKAQLTLVRKELDELVARFGDSRRTVIVDESEEPDEEVEEGVAEEDVVITVSRQGFVARMPVHLYRRRVGSGRALAGMDNYEDDWLERVFTARTAGWLLAFTEKGRAHFVSVLAVPESARASRGQSIYALASADRNDRIVSLVPVEDLKAPGRALLFVTRGGTVKRTSLEELSNPRAGGVIATGVRDGDAVLEVVLSDDRAEVMLLTRSGRAIRFEEKDVPLQGRTAQGVKGIGLQDDDAVVGVILVRRDASVLTMTEEGMGKRTALSEFPLQKRGGLGTLAVPAGASGLGLVGALEVVPGDEVTVVSAGGAVTQVEADKVPEQGRRTRGSRLVRLASGDRVVEVTHSVGRGRGGDDAGGPDGGRASESPAEVGPGVAQEELFS